MFASQNSSDLSSGRRPKSKAAEFSYASVIVHEICDLHLSTFPFNDTLIGISGLYRARASFRSNDGIQDAMLVVIHPAASAADLIPNLKIYNFQEACTRNQLSDEFLDSVQGHALGNLCHGLLVHLCGNS